MELHVIPLEESNRYIIYRPLLALAFIGNKAMADLCSKSTPLSPASQDNKTLDQAIRFLTEIGFFLPDVQPAHPDFIRTTAVLLLTNGCQLRCTYCYAAAGKYKRRNLEIKSGVAVIDYVYQQARMHNRDSFRVDFHGGGEPSLEWQSLQEFTHYARRKPIPAQISLTSNAIWSKRQCNWIIKNIDQLSISMDGKPETQNRQRPFENHYPSSPIVMNNLHRLDDSGFASYGIRMTACHPWTHLSSDVEYILENTSCRAIQVEPAFNIQRGAHASPDQDQYKQFVIAFQDAYNVADKNNAKLSYSGARPGTMSGIFCTAPYNAIVVNPENYLVACYEIVNPEHPQANLSTFGKIQAGTVWIDEKKRKSFYETLQDRFNKICTDCYCRWTCAGDCFTRAFSEKGGHLEFGPRCLMNREITKNIILNLIHKQQGVWRSFSPSKAAKEFYYGKARTNPSI
jgi:uncharacterized protein